MSLQNIKDQVIQYINDISNLDLAKLYVDGVSVVEWNQIDSKEIGLYVNDILGILKKITENITILESLDGNYLNNLKNNLRDFINHFNGVRDMAPQHITSHHHNALNNLSTINSILRSTGLYSQLKFVPNFDEITQKLKSANDALIQFNNEEFNKAIALVDELVSKKISFEDKTIKEHLGTFIKNANDHRIHRSVSFFSLKFSGQWWWLFWAGIMGIIVAFIVFSFISVLENKSDISAGVAILRISSLIIPSYFTFFFISQFNYHKKMYETYNFKNTALNTMSELMKLNQSKSDYILEKGLSVLFNEPQVREDNKYDKQLINDLLGIVKSQLNNK